MKHKNWARYLGVGLLATWVGFAWAQTGAPMEDQEVRGVVQLWAPGAQRIEVDGKAYRVARDVQVVDKETRLLPAQRVRPGVPVLLLLSEGIGVTHVVVQPGDQNPFDQVGR
jgi:hypothetical protein